MYMYWEVNVKNYCIHIFLKSQDILVEYKKQFKCDHQIAITFLEKRSWA
jgi:hypothetical protein